jgi:hypothetical protein
VIKVRLLLGTLWGQHVRNLGTHCFESISPLPTLQNRERGKKKKKKKKRRAWNVDCPSGK